MPGSTTTSTSIFNMVLNTIGASGFASALNTAQSGINGVVVSLNKAGQAAATGRVNSELQSAAYEKQEASLNRAKVSLDVFTIKIQQNAQALGALQTEQGYLINQVSELTDVLAYQRNVYDNLDSTVVGAAGIQASWKNRVTETTAALGQMTSRLGQVNKDIDAATAKEQLYQAQLKARETRIAASAATLEELKKPLSTFESIIATAIQVYDTVDKVSKTFDRLTLTLQRVERIWINLKNIMSGNLSGNKSGVDVSGMGQISPDALASQNALQVALGKSRDGLGFFASAAATALGTTFTNMLSAAVQGVQQLAGEIEHLGQQGFTAAGSLEAFNTSLKAMLGVQKVETNSLLSMKDAMSSSAGEAADLIKWVEHLGIFSPFLVQTAKDSLQLSVAMGFTVDKAKELTKAVFDWGAGTGKTDEQVQSIVRMLGQMNSLGTFNGRIIREMGFSGISLTNIYREMSKQTGISVDKLKDLEKQGKITAEVGVNAVLGFMHKFDDQATNMAGTIRGLTTSLTSMGDMLLQHFIGPLDTATQKVGGIAGAIQKELQKVVDFVSQQWVSDLVTQMGTALGHIAEDAFVWGENITTQLANGMLAAIGNLLSSLTSIGDYISYWLQPGSPPKLLPDIGDWGKSAISEFFKGFSQIDFSLFDSMSSDIEKHLRAVMIKQPSDKEGVLNNILGERGAMASAIAELDRLGSVSEASFQKIFSAMGGATKETENYIRTSIALEIQNRKVTAAQTELDAVTKKYNDLLKPLDTQLQSITDAQTTLADEQQKTMLELILKDPNATLAEKARARLQIDKLTAEEKKMIVVAGQKKEVDAAQAKVDAETLKQKALMATLELQKSILSAEDQQIALMQEYYDLMKQLINENNKEKAGKGGGGTPIADLPGKKPKASANERNREKPEPPGPPKWLTDLEGALAKAQEAVKKAAAAMWEQLKPARDALDQLGKAWDGLTGAVGKDGEEIKKWLAQLAVDTMTHINIGAVASINNLTAAVKDLQGGWEKNHVLIEKIASKVWLLVIDLIMSMVWAVSLAVRFIAWIFNNDWEKAWDDWVKPVLDAPGKFQWFLDHVISNLVSFIPVFVQKITDWWEKTEPVIAKKVSAVIKILSDMWEKFKKDAAEKITHLIAQAEKWMTDTSAKIETGKKAIEALFAAIFEALKTKVDTQAEILIGKFKKWITDTQSAISDQLDKFNKLGGSIISALEDGAKAAAKGMIDAVVGTIANALEAARALLGHPKSPSPVSRKLLGQPLGEGIVQGLLDSKDTLQTAMRQMIGDSMNVSMIGGPGMASAGSSTSTSNTTNFNYSPTYGGAPSPTSDNFALMQAMVV